MALPDPIPTITVNSVTYDLVRTGLGKGESTYQTANGLDRLSISHSAKNRNRDVVRLDRTKVAATPFDAGLNQEYSMSTYVVTDTPRRGFTAAEKDWHWKLLVAVMAEGTIDYSLRILADEI